MNIVFTVLGIIDIIAAALIFFPTLPLFESILMYIMVYMLTKGGFFLITGLVSRSIGPHCIVLCISDLLVGLALGMMAFGFSTTSGIVGSFISTVGMFGVVKGIYTAVYPLLS